MALLLLIVSILDLITLPVYSYVTFTSPPPLPILDDNAWWGPSELNGKQNSCIIPFEVSFDEDMIGNLKYQLKRCKNLTPPLEDANFTYGFNTDALYSWCSYWAEEYPFSERETFFNQYPQYKAFIQGLWIHFIRVTPEVPSGVEVIPLILLHGWPGSVREFYEAIPLLTAYDETRDFAIEVIIPSLPGFGFSDAAVRSGLAEVEIAVIFNKLMNLLGFKQYYAHGGDWGSGIASMMATIYPENVLGYHSAMPLVLTALSSINEFIGTLYPALQNDTDSDTNLADRMYELQNKYATLLEETGYLHIQATKPDTLGIALSDSPSGILAYILQMFSTWTNIENRNRADGGLGIKWTKEKLIDNLMMYWVPRSITTSIRLYAESFNTKSLDLKIADIQTSVPTWLIRGKHELLYQPEYIYQFKYTNLLNSTVLDDGGHFLAFELPEIFSEDVHRAIAGFRKQAENNVKSDL